MLGITLGLVFGSYILYMLSTIAKEMEFLKYISVFTLADIRNVIQNVEINPIMIVSSLILSLVFFIITMIHYNKKELV